MSQNGTNEVDKEVEDEDEKPFQFGFIDMPWDDRTKQSKIAIVVLLASIFIGTMAFVFNYFSIQNVSKIKNANKTNKELACHMVKVDDFRFIARIYSIKDLKAICVGAVVSHTVVLTSEECAQSGPIVIRLGSWSEPRCRKNFAVDIISNPHYAEKIPNEVAFLRTLENINECASVASIGQQIDLSSRVYIVGRIQHGGKLLSRQPIILDNANCTVKPETALALNDPNMLKHLICAESSARCPIISGDLMMQNEKIYGLALATTKLGHRELVVPFWKIKFIEQIINLIN